MREHFKKVREVGYRESRCDRLSREHFTPQVRDATEEFHRRISKSMAPFVCGDNECIKVARFEVVLRIKIVSEWRSLTFSVFV